jgi:hypothetical protein
MSQSSTLAALDARVHAAFARAGYAFTGMYTPPGGNLALPVSGYLNLGVQVGGQFGQVLSRRDEMELLAGDGLGLAKDGRVFIEDVKDSGIGETWNLEKQLGDDGSLTQWVVRRV